MINISKNQKLGIKNENDDIYPFFEELLLEANSFIIMAGYNFTPPWCPGSLLDTLIDRKKKGVECLLIAPPSMFGFGKDKHLKTLELISNSDIGVIINNLNHSKWILTDTGYYFGSCNFSRHSMSRKIEVASICFDVNQDTNLVLDRDVHADFLLFTVKEIEKSENKIFKNPLSLNAFNRTYISSLYSLILRYNPDISKIEKTVENSALAESYLFQIIENSIFNIDNSILSRISSEVYRIFEPLQKLIDYAVYEILNKNFFALEISSEVFLEYNRLYEIYIKTLAAVEITFRNTIEMEIESEFEKHAVHRETYLSTLERIKTKVYSY